MPHVEDRCTGRQRHHQHRPFDHHHIPGRRRRSHRRAARRYHQPAASRRRSTKSSPVRPKIPAASILPAASKPSVGSTSKPSSTPVARRSSPAPTTTTRSPSSPATVRTTRPIQACPIRCWMACKISPCRSTTGRYAVHQYAEFACRCFGRQRRNRRAGTGAEPGRVERANLRRRRHAIGRHRQFGRYARTGNSRHAKRDLRSRRSGLGDSYGAGVTFGTPSPVDSAQFNDTTNTSKITATTFSIAGFYQSSPGGVEQFRVSGRWRQRQSDLPFAKSRRLRQPNQLHPGATQDSGTITAAGTFGQTTLVPLSSKAWASAPTQSLSAVPIQYGGRVDSLTVNGSRFERCLYRQRHCRRRRRTVQLAGVLGCETLVINTPGIAQLDLNGVGGTDFFNVWWPFHTPAPPWKAAIRSCTSAARPAP